MHAISYTLSEFVAPILKNSIHCSMGNYIKTVHLIVS